MRIRGEAGQGICRCTPAIGIGCGRRVLFPGRLSWFSEPGTGKHGLLLRPQLDEVMSPYMKQVCTRMLQNQTHAGIIPDRHSDNPEDSFCHLIIRL